MSVIRRRALIAALLLCAAAQPVMADVVAVVSAKSAVTALSKSQTADIFMGKVSHFPDGQQAVPIDQAEGSAAREEFYVKVAARTPAQMKAYWSKIIFTGRGQPPKEAANSAELKRRIAEDPTAIGYIDANLVDESLRVVR